MADVQLEHGYTRIANALLEALAGAALPGARHFQVMLAMIRQLYGYNRAEDRISASQVAQMTGLDVRSAQRVLSELVEWHLLICESTQGRTALWRIQKDSDQWSIPVRSQRGNLRRGQPRSSAAAVVSDLGLPRPHPPAADAAGTYGVDDLHQRQKDSSPKTAESARRKRAPKAAKQAAGKTPAQLCIGAFCEEYRAERDAAYRPNGRDAKAVKDLVALSAVDPEEIRLAARIYFKDADEFVKQNSYPLWLFVDRFTRYDVRAQKRARNGLLELPAREPAPEPSESDMNSFRSATPWSR